MAPKHGKLVSGDLTSMSMNSKAAISICFSMDFPPFSLITMNAYVLSFFLNIDGASYVTNQSQRLFTCHVMQLYSTLIG